MSSCLGLTLSTGDFQIDRAMRIALGDVLGNVAYYHSGLLERPLPCLLAGLSYPDPWTRDTAINTWNGIGLLLPEVMKNTMLACLTRGDVAAGHGAGCEDMAGSIVPPDVLSISGQYWDRVIWAIGAWAYYCQNGDRDFLAMALEATGHTLHYLETREFDESFGLFRGGACIHDGISAYGDIYADHEGSAIFEWPAANTHRRHPQGAGVPIMALSTNCLYVEAYRLAEVMAQELGEPANPQWAVMRARVKDGIRQHLWLQEPGHFRHYLDPWGGCGGRQDALGNAFALLFDIPTTVEAAQVFAHQEWREAGPPAIWPEWPRYTNADLDQYQTPMERDDIAAENVVLRSDMRSITKYGSHSGSVWPFMQGFWGEAALLHGHHELFAQQLRVLAGHLCHAVQSPEIVHPDCGLPYGGIQEGLHRTPIQRGVSCYRQTWTATAFIRLVLHGLLGLKCQPDGLRFSPFLPAGVDCVELLGLPWREAVLHLTLNTAATDVLTLTLDGKAIPGGLVPAGLTGDHTVSITVPRENA